LDAGEIILTACSETEYRHLLLLNLYKTIQKFLNYIIWLIVNLHQYKILPKN